MKSKRLAAALAAAAMVGTAGALAPVTAHAELKPVITEIKPVEGSTTLFTVSYTGCPKADMGETEQVEVFTTHPDHWSPTEVSSNPTASGEGVIEFERGVSGPAMLTLSCGSMRAEKLFEVKNTILEINDDAEQGDGKALNIRGRYFKQREVVTFFVTDPAGKRTQLGQAVSDEADEVNLNGIDLPRTYQGVYKIDATSEKSGYTGTGDYVIKDSSLPKYTGQDPEKPKPEKPAPEKPKPEKPAPAKPAPGKKAPAKNKGLPSTGV